MTSLPPSSYLLHEAYYAAHLQTLPTHQTFEAYRSLRHHMAWMGQTRPHLVSMASIASQVTPASFCKAIIKPLNGAAQLGHAFPDRGLISHIAQKSYLRIIIFADDLFLNIEDAVTQLGFAVFLSDQVNRENFVHYTSYKSKRVVSTVLGRELYRLADPFDYAY